MDDPKLCVDLSGCDSAYISALGARRPALAISPQLHCDLVAVLGSESADRGVDGSPANTSWIERMATEKQVVVPLLCSSEYNRCLESR